MSVYTSLLCILYLESRPCPSSPSRLQLLYGTVRPLAEYLMVLISLYVSATRVADHWNHNTDVVVGAVVGAVMAVGVHCNVIQSKLFLPLGDANKEEHYQTL